MTLRACAAGAALAPSPFAPCAKDAAQIAVPETKATVIATRLCVVLLAMNQLEHAGLVRTDPDDPSQMVTDSAAAATAFSTGVKSYNGAIATGPDRLPRTTLLELAKASGKRPDW